ncbi:phosphatase [Pullulanibacillus camelliae]|uniref:Phosphatase n=1 Tax=Pullulanibacillus camelliae TaxID=1707096 RepID=A0A8J2YDS7_9BACL|nr:Cof-type HAD-IIB family hydrolase [Pullulanibacillus camelliae]GGE40831.1 phosphatase [Pullulanibacillus camelliae]
MGKPSIIFFDLDGTILNSHKKIPESTREAIRILRQKGVTPAIATGRAPFMFEWIRQELGINTFVSFNGQYVVHEGKEVYKNPIALQNLVQLKKIADQHEHPLVFLSHEGMGAENATHPFIKEGFASLKEKAPQYAPDYYKTHPIYQGLLFSKPGEAESYLSKLVSFDSIQWHEYSLDILPKGGSKAEGIKKLIEYLGIKREETAAFGDGLNDIQMLTFVGQGIAMGNGHIKAKKAADHITDSSDEDGIMNGLKYLGLM